AESETGIDARRLAALQEWLPDGYIDLKRMDALTCLGAALRLDLSACAPYRPPPETLFSLFLAEQVAAGLRPE
ncbi:MAG: hypothetical protein ACR2FH_07340, partial [Caulobacteraceae bacterium]